MPKRKILCSWWAIQCLIIFGRGEWSGRGWQMLRLLLPLWNAMLCEFWTINKDENQTGEYLALLAYRSNHTISGPSYPRRLKVIRNSLRLKMFEECGLLPYLEFRYERPTSHDFEWEWVLFATVFCHCESESDKNWRHEVCKFATWWGQDTRLEWASLLPFYTENGINISTSIHLLDE